MCMSSCRIKNIIHRKWVHSVFMHIFGINSYVGVPFIIFYAKSQNLHRNVCFLALNNVCCENHYTNTFNLLHNVCYWDSYSSLARIIHRHITQNISIAFVIIQEFLFILFMRLFSMLNLKSFSGTSWVVVVMLMWWWSSPAHDGWFRTAGPQGWVGWRNTV